MPLELVNLKSQVCQNILFLETFDRHQDRIRSVVNVRKTNLLQEGIEEANLREVDAHEAVYVVRLPAEINHCWIVFVRETD